MFLFSRSLREALRTTLWIVPSVMVVLVALLFALTYTIDGAAAKGVITLPAWVSVGGPDVARQTLTALAAIVITVAGVVFSITIVVLQLASQQFGPRMLRTFIRDLGTQVSLGAFVATFVFATLALGSVQSSPAPVFIPHLSVTVALVLTVIDQGVLIYFIHHVATSIQLTTVVSGIARDFQVTLAATRKDARQLQLPHPSVAPALPAAAAMALVFADTSGFLQAIGHARLVSIAASERAVIWLSHRPGHFLVQGQPLGRVAPPEVAPAVSAALAREHLIGPHRTLTQDPGFALDQLVEIAIRALSPAVNDTFTALNCIDWLGDCLCRAAGEPLPDGIYRDQDGTIRLIEPVITLERLIKGATDKIRQAGHGMPAVLIRQLENLAKLLVTVRTEEQRAIVVRHAGMILSASEASIGEARDRGDVQAIYDGLIAQAQRAHDAEASDGAEQMGADD